MRRLILFFLLASALTFFAAPKHHLTPSPTPTATPKFEMVCRTKQQDLELRDWIAGLMNQVHLAQADASAAKKTNDDAVAKLGMSITDAANFIKQCASDQACAKAPLSCWFHRLIKHIFWIAGAIVVLLVVLIVINIMTGGALSGFFSIFGTIGKWIAALIPKPKPPTDPPPKV